MSREASITKADVLGAVAAIRSGETVTSVCRRLGCSRVGMYKAASRYGVTLSARKAAGDAQLIGLLAAMTAGSESQ